MRQIILTFIAIPIIIQAINATIINIPDDYTTIQEGIDASYDGDTVLVQPGTYVENINFNGHNIVLGSLFLTTGDTSYISQTIIDGDSSGSVVTFENGEDSMAHLTGFTIQNGFAELGGGILCDSNSSAKILRCNIIDNVAMSEFDWPILPPGAGGGIAIVASSPTLQGCRLSGNDAHSGVDHYGLGIPGMGGAIFSSESEPIIRSCFISDNGANLGGGVFLHNSNGIITASEICDNLAAAAPLGIIGSGGGIFFYDSNPVINNNVISGNSSNYGGGIYCGGSHPNIVNTVFWADSASSDGEEIYIDNSSFPEISFCNIQAGWEGEGNIDLDPLFRNPDNGDFHLMAIECGDTIDSPCIDAGQPDLLDSLLDCERGLGELRSDMGAYGGGDSVQMGINNPQPRVPSRIMLIQNYPNPFNATTTIQYNLPKASDITIDIYDILGRKVETLVNAQQQAGYRQVIWNANEFTSGLYFYKIQAGDYIETKKMLLLK